MEFIVWIIVGSLAMVFEVGLYLVIDMITKNKTYLDMWWDFIEEIEVINVLQLSAGIILWPITLLLGSIFLTMFFCIQMKGIKLFKRREKKEASLK